MLRALRSSLTQIEGEKRFDDSRMLSCNAARHTNPDGVLRRNEIERGRPALRPCPIPGGSGSRSRTRAGVAASITRGTRSPGAHRGFLVSVTTLPPNHPPEGESLEKESRERDPVAHIVLLPRVEGTLTPEGYPPTGTASAPAGDPAPR